jgi:hypothetical protein
VRHAMDLSPTIHDCGSSVVDPLQLQRAKVQGRSSSQRVNSKVGCKWA